MAVFFFVVGLELKREILVGELSDRRRIALPLFAALGGMVLPACIYAFFNAGDAQAMGGWAIPVATDIAFALGVLSLLGARVPGGLKVFLVSLAIFDDIGAVVIIALFYAGDLSHVALGVAAGCMIVLALLNRRGVAHVRPYLLVGLVMWVAVLKSGVHATLAGVLLAMFIPLQSGRSERGSPLKRLEKGLHRPVSLFILPIFAFANAGLSLSGVGVDEMLHPVPLGIVAGLFVGKQAGVFLFAALAVWFGLASLPRGAGWMSLYGVSLLCGIGFTMSLFIGSLAFEEGVMRMLFDERLGIILGSVLSAFCGLLVLHIGLPGRKSVAGMRKND